MSSLASEQASRMRVRTHGCPVIMAVGLVRTRETVDFFGNQGGTADLFVRP